ncbi:hypothetical protein ONE63_002009 [Megalurothrips usitatus]|uniref:LIM zinc-binding domain-containing protein n=1 Tax=Megalurothrips usitatus TaxID=439358 RepID=A0AAV7XDY5_9NEOP|nr:hypothetical protein ONE63_002009 [Megalurothrips usitatus]
MAERAGTPEKVREAVFVTRSPVLSSTVPLLCPDLPRPRRAPHSERSGPAAAPAHRPPRVRRGVFVRIKDKNLHVECFKCATCGTPLKNVGYYNLNNKLYCDIHAKLVARQNPPAPNLEPVTVPPGARPPAGTISNALAGLGVTAGPPSAAPLSPQPSGGLSPQPGTVGPLPFHAPRVGTSHVNAPKPQTASNVSGPRPFGSPLAAPPAPAPSNAFGRPATGYTPSSGFAPSSTFAPSSGFAPSPGFASTLKPLTKLRGGPGGAKGGAFAGASAPIRGRGILNPAAIGGTRVPLCGACNQQIRGPFITALGKIWCPHHFVCSNGKCARPLQDIGFVEEKGHLYCEYCFEQFIAPPCDKCGHKIKGDCLNAIGKHFHPECFNCVYCGKLFGNSPFFLEDGQPYCENDWNELFTTKCFACGFPIEAGDRWVEALSNNYHSQCFNCSMCKKNLEGQSFFAKGGRPFCKNHAR